MAGLWISHGSKASCEGDIDRRLYPASCGKVSCVSPYQGSHVTDVSFSWRSMTAIYGNSYGSFLWKRINRPRATCGFHQARRQNPKRLPRKTARLECKVGKEISKDKFSQPHVQRSHMMIYSPFVIVNDHILYDPCASCFWCRIN